MKALKKKKTKLEKQCNLLSVVGLLKSWGVLISILFPIHSLICPIWWRQKQPITLQIMSAAVALPFMADLSLCSGLHVPLSCLPFQSAPARLPGPGCSRCRLIPAYLHYITSYLNEACWETSKDVDRHWTHAAQSKAEQDLTEPQVSLAFSPSCMVTIETITWGYW